MSQHRTPGQRAGLTREAILDAALALADREGLAALSMRRLGADLGVEAMTLYHHVSNKDELLDGLVERVISHAQPPSRDTHWRTGLEGFARRLHTALLRHPHTLSLIASRPAVTAGNIDAMENALHMLREGGFTLDESVDIFYALIGFVVAQAATAGPGPDLGLLSGLDPERHPLLAEAARTTTGDNEARFGFALRALLDGFAART